MRKRQYGHAGLRGRADLSIVSYELLAPIVVAGEESAEEAAIRERSIELLFSKKDLKDTEHRRNLNHILAHERELEDFGRLLLHTALTIQSGEAFEWYNEGQKQFSQELPSRVVSNLACCYVGLCMLEKVCVSTGYAWDSVFPYRREICTKYLEHAAKDYLLDGDNGNKSVVEQTFEIMARMKLDPKVHYTIDGDRLYLWMGQVYDLYTKFRKDYAIVGEVLTEPQFKKQLKFSEFYIAHNYQKRIGSENRKCWVVDFDLLSKRCDVSGFLSTEVVPLI